MSNKHVNQFIISSLAKKWLVHKIAREYMRVGAGAGAGAPDCMRVGMK